MSEMASISSTIDPTMWNMSRTGALIDGPDTGGNRWENSVMKEALCGGWKAVFVRIIFTQFHAAQCRAHRPGHLIKGETKKGWRCMRGQCTRAWCFTIETVRDGSIQWERGMNNYSFVSEYCLNGEWKIFGYDEKNNQTMTTGNFFVP